LGRLFHLFNVHRFIDHSGNFYIPAQRYPTHTVFGFSFFKFEKGEPGIEKEIELFDAGFKNFGGNEMSKFVKNYKDREAQKKLNDFYKDFHTVSNYG
jgi:hypothetical protein